MSTTVDEQQVVEKEVALPSGPGWDVKLTYEQTLAGLKELAAERPDYVYEKQLVEGLERCLYIHEDGSPGCIVGNLAIRAGVDPTLVKAYESRFAGELPIWADAQAGRLAGEAQVNQDCGRPWAEAVSDAVVRANA